MQRGRDRGDAASRATAAGRAGPADRGDVRRRRAWTVDELDAVVARGAYPFSRPVARRSSRACWTCWPAATPATSSPSCARGSSGTGSPARVRGREGARALAVQNAGTIPDRGLFGVFLADGRSRVGELDEEMVYEARSGQTFVLGASSWRIEEITRDRVIVSPPPARPADAVLEGRGGRAARRARRARSGELARELRRDRRRRGRRAAAPRELPRRARRGQPGARTSPTRRRRPAWCPSDRAIVVERFRDEIGDWRLCVLSPFGARVHAPWALALGARLRASDRQRGARDLVRRRHRPCTCRTPTRRRPPRPP